MSLVDARRIINRATKLPVHISQFIISKFLDQVQVEAGVVSERLHRADSIAMQIVPIVGSECSAVAMFSSKSKAMLACQPRHSNVTEIVTRGGESAL